MDTVSLITGFAVGGALAGMAVYALLKSSAARLQRAEASLQAKLDATSEQLAQARRETAAERERADTKAREEARVREDLRAAQVQVQERERAITELKASFEEQRAKLADAFKATGADILKSTAETLVKQAKEQFDGQHKLSQQDLESRQKAIDETIKPLKEQLAKQETLVKQLGEKREGDVRTMGELLRNISELQIKASSAAQSLSSALRDNRQRGRWGEVGLRTVVELAGLVEGVHFTQQQSFDGAEGRLRPDMVVRLPGDRYIPIDSKLPLDSYLSSLEPERTDEERLALRQAHADAVRSHVRALARKNYAAEIPGEIEFTVLYIELESGFTAAFETDPAIHEEAMRSRVLVVTPSTLLALLRTVAMYWSNAEVNDKAVQIRDEAKELVERVGVLVRHLNSAGQRLGATVEAFNKAVGSFDRMFVPQLNKVASIVALPPVKVDEGPSDTPRKVNRPESGEDEAAAELPAPTEIQADQVASGAAFEVR